MKKLNDFQNEKVELKTIWGGQHIATSDTCTNENGCTVTTTDLYRDVNGNGQHDSGEPISGCQVIKCN